MGKTPAELLMNRLPKTRFDLLRQKSMEMKQQVKIFQDNSDFKAEFKPNQAVFVLNFGKGAKWLPGVVLKEISPRNFEVQVEDVIWERHCTQMRTRFIPTSLIPRRKEEEFTPTEIPRRKEEEFTPTEIPTTPDLEIKKSSWPELDCKSKQSTSTEKEKKGERRQPTSTEK